MLSTIGIGLVRGPHKINWWVICLRPLALSLFFLECATVWCGAYFVKFACDFLRHLNDSSSSWTIHIPFPFEATTVTLTAAHTVSNFVQHTARYTAICCHNPNRSLN
jgi:hypothetical protein